jgi:uncharacterized protein
MGSDLHRERMMAEIHESLLALQDLDREIADAAGRVAEFEPQLAELDAPLDALEREIGELTKQLEATTTEARKLERAAEEKQDRLKRYEERLMRVRTAREEAAASTELDLVRHALEADEREALERGDLARRLELKLDELTAKRDELVEELAPRRRELLEQRAVLEAELELLQKRREGQTESIAVPVRRLYERVRGGKTGTVLAALTKDGACGCCFSVVPLQRQSEIRRGGALVRCEVCGVILYSAG